jgi:hypothetical protein
VVSKIQGARAKRGESEEGRERVRVGEIKRKPE